MTYFDNILLYTDDRTCTFAFIEMNDEDVSSDSGSDEESRMIRQQERLYTDPLSDLTSEISLLLPTPTKLLFCCLPSSILSTASFFFF
jgi:hypothetical protein